MRKSESLQLFMNVLAHNKWSYLFSSFMFVLVIFFRTLEPKIFQLLTDVTISISNQGLEASQDVFSFQFIRFFTPFFSHEIYASLFFFALLYILVTCARSTLVFLAHILNSKSTEKMLSNLRDKLFSHLQQIPIHYFVDHSKGSIIQRSSNDLEVIKIFFQNNFVESVRIVFLVLFSLGIMMQISVMATFVSICLMPLVVYLSIRFSQEEKKIWEEHEKESDRLNTLIQENIQGIRTTKAYAAEKPAIRQFEEQNQRKLQAGLKHNHIHSSYWPVMNLVVFTQIVLSNIFTIYLTSKGLLSVGELLGIGIYVNMMLWPLRRVSSIISNYTMSMVALRRINELMQIPKEENKQLPFIHSKQRLIGDIQLENVSFRYPNQQEYALKNINLSIPGGKTVALIGPTGAGKSTLYKLLLRLYEPETGSIWLDGQPLAHYPRNFLRTRCGFTLQNSILFSDTIKENMRTFSPEASQLKIQEAFRLASISELSDTNNNWMEKMIGEKGVNLSGGQKQRMALARVFLNDKDMYLFDDVTSYIDEINERTIWQSVREKVKGKTCLIVSHKVSAISFADHIIVLDKGHILAQGSPDELARKEGYYKTIIELQSSSKQAHYEFIPDNS